LSPRHNAKGLDENLLDNRKAFYEAARARHPQRWSGCTRNWQRIQAVHLNPDKAEAKEDNTKEVIIQKKKQPELSVEATTTLTITAMGIF
jgi:hypothetical protein